MPSANKLDDKFSSVVIAISGWTDAMHVSPSSTLGFSLQASCMPPPSSPQQNSTVSACPNQPAALSFGQPSPALTLGTQHHPGQFTSVHLTQNTNCYSMTAETPKVACCDGLQGADAFEHDPALADCCRRDLREQAHVQRVKKTLLEHDVTTQRLKLAESAFLRDPLARPCLDDSDRDSLESDNEDGGKCLSLLSCLAL